MANRRRNSNEGARLHDTAVLWGTPPRQKQPAILMDACRKGFAGGEFEVLASGPLSRALVRRNLPGLSIVSGKCAGLRVHRTHTPTANRDDGFVFWITVEGAGAACQAGCVEALMPGEGILFSCADGGELAFPSNVEFIWIRVLRQAWCTLVPDAEAACLKPIPKCTQALRLLRAYLSMLDETGILLNAGTDLEAGRVFAAQVHDLVTLALGAVQCGLEPADSRGGRNVSLHEIETGVANLLQNPALSITDVAARHGVSPRYIQMLFQTRGTTFSKFLLTQRLARARSTLSDPANTKRTICDIAYESGFSDLSHFNRGFRRRYGVTPSEIRACLEAAARCLADAGNWLRQELPWAASDGRSCGPAPAASGGRNAGNVKRE